MKPKLDQYVDPVAQKLSSLKSKKPHFQIKLKKSFQTSFISLSVNGKDCTKKLTSPKQAARPKWHLVYYLLAAFDVLVVSTSFYLNHQMMEVYTESIQVNQQWTAQRNHISELGTLASKVNAPGNDAFDTHDIAAEFGRMRAALTVFNQQMVSIQGSLQQTPDLEMRDSVLTDLKVVDQRMTEMVSEANLIFSYLQRNQPKAAGQQMAAMDRKYANLTTALYSLQTNVSQIQEQVLGEQAAIAADLQKLQYFIAVFVLFMVGGATAYGHHLTKQMQFDKAELQRHLLELNRTQAHLIQSEKMSSLGQLVAGIAHELNNPVSFIYGNVTHAQEYVQDLLKVMKLYQQNQPNLSGATLAELESVDLEFLETDFPRLLTSMKVGSDRIQQIVKSLRTFSRLDEAELKVVDVHNGIDSTLMVLQSRLKAKLIRALGVDYLCPEILVTKDFGNLPPVECYPGQLNQVFLYILNNAIEALDRLTQQRTPAEIEANLNQIHIYTEVLETNWVAIHIADNGPGMSNTVKSRLFDPFFTTKPVGQGTGLGLSICYQIVVETHGGDIQYTSTPGYGTEFVVKIPIRQQSKQVGMHEANGQSVQRSRSLQLVTQ